MQIILKCIFYKSVFALDAFAENTIKMTSEGLPRE